MSTLNQPINNPLLISIDDSIDYAAIKPAHIKPAIEALIAQSRTAIETVANQTSAYSWQTVVTPIDDASGPLWRAWSVVGHLNAVINSLELRDAYNEMLSPMSEFSTWVGLNEGLFNCYQQLAQSPAYDQWPADKQRIVNKAIQSFQLSGVALVGQDRKRYAEISEKQAEVSQKFSEHVLDANDAWSLTLDDVSDLDGVPADVIQAAQNLAINQINAQTGAANSAEVTEALGAATAGDTSADDTANTHSAATANVNTANKNRYQLSLKMPCYLPVMQYAHNRALRATLYRAYATLASDQGDSKFDNSPLIETALSLRAEEARLLGFSDYAALRLETRMAQDANEVLQFLRDLAHRAKPFAQKDFDTLKAFAKNECGLNDIEPWDIAYLSERLRQAHYNYSEDEVKQYFTEPQVLKGLFEIVEQVFQVRLTETPVNAWHPDVKAANVVDQSGQFLGQLMIDLHARSGKQGGAWVNDERTRRQTFNALTTPIVYLTCNFAQGQGERAAVLTHDDVITLFHEMGHALHALLSEVDEPAASAFAAVEWDAIELPSQFMENFCWERTALKRLSAHVETGASLPDNLIDKLIAARNFQSGMQTVRQIEFSLFDMLLHQTGQSIDIATVMQTLDAVRDEVSVMKPPHWHRFPHAFTHLFAGGYGAGYYSYKWAEVLSADAFEAFEEANHTLDPQTGDRFRREILAVGGKRPAAESFEAFRGRKPRIDALLRHHGMQEGALKT
jgi:oligopeptidase A